MLRADTCFVRCHRSWPTEGHHARWILAHILDWHRREDKATWWEYFRLSALSSDELLDERAGLSGLTYIGPAGGTAKAPVHRHRFPPQETELRGDEDLRQLGGEKLGKVESISLDDRTIDIKKRQDTANVHPEAVFAHQIVDAQVLADALVRIGEYVADHGLIGEGPYQAARDLRLYAGLLCARAQARRQNSQRQVACAACAKRPARDRDDHCMPCLSFWSWSLPSDNQAWQH